MLLMDVEHKCWSKEMMDICGVTEEQLPKLYESYEVVGSLKPEVAAELGLSENVKIIAGSEYRKATGRTACQFAFRNKAGPPSRAD